MNVTERQAEEHVCIGCGRRMTNHPSQICGLCANGEPAAMEHMGRHRGRKSRELHDRPMEFEDRYDEESGPDDVCDD